MPNVWTHIHFGETAAKRIGYTPPPGNENYFKLGTQGPDPFFYHRFWPWLNEKPVSEVGGNIHYRECGPFLTKLIRCGNESDPLLQAYILGFVTHHLLDRNAHPYINYRSGNEGNKHQKLEMIIDTLLMEKWRGLRTWKTPVYKEIFVGTSLYKPVQDTLEDLIKTFFPETAAQMPVNYINQSYRDMIKALRLLYDPRGWKNNLLRQYVSSFSYQKVTDNADFLNNNRKEWLHPVDQEEKRHESFVDLYDNAIQEGDMILPAILDYWTEPSQEKLNDIKEKLGNLSYDTGKDCTRSVTNQYFEPIL